jgi:hypothetical protein
VNVLASACLVCREGVWFWLAGKEVAGDCRTLVRGREEGAAEEA